MSDNLSPGRQTPLYEKHKAAGAKMTDFGGWAMPVQYGGVLEEHQAVRTAAGLFDVSHMGEVIVKGEEALPFLQYLLPNDVARIGDGQILYTPMCYPHGGIVDDLLVYRFNARHFYLVINASNIGKDFTWIEEHAACFAVNVENISDLTAQLALQGPNGERILQRLTDIDLGQIKYYWFKEGKIAGVPCLISRTGYTGEDGFEFYFDPEHAGYLWDEVLKAGEDEGIKPAGLGARDTLRLEARLPLYGHELGDGISPLEAGISMFVKLDKKEDFLGKTALLAQKEQGVRKRLVGMEMIEKGIARAAYPVLKEGESIGYITSGSYSPTLEKNIALALVEVDHAVIGNELSVLIRNKPVKGRIVPAPFYKRKK